MLVDGATPEEMEVEDAASQASGTGVPAAAPPLPADISGEAAEYQSGVEGSSSYCTAWAPTEEGSLMGDRTVGSPDSPEEPPVGPDDGGVAFEHAAGEPDAAGQPAQGKKAEWMHILTRQQSPLGRTHY